MTTLDHLALPHIQALLAALDAGEDAVLPYLCDALEEAGDARAAGLRRLGRHRPLEWATDRWAWVRDLGRHAPGPGALLDAEFFRLTKAEPGVYYHMSGSRSAAMLALAEALTP